MTQINCEILNIGTELVEGKGSDSSLLLSSLLTSIGVTVQKISVLPDNISSVKDSLECMSKDTCLVFLIGGLGSTPDDITRQAVAEYLKSELVFSKQAMVNVARYFADRSLDVPKCCESQSEIIKGAVVVDNREGSCPAQIIETAGRNIILLPGPFTEVKHLVDSYFYEYLKKRFERSIRKKKVFHIADRCESEVAEMLEDIIRQEEKLEEGEIRFSYNNNPSGCDLSVECWGNNELLIDEVLHKLKREIKNIVEADIYAEDNSSIERVIGRMLTRSKKTLSVAESCTGGLLSSIITDAPGSSVYFKEGIVAYSSSRKVKRLSVKEEDINKFSPVSEEIAYQMAENIRKISSTDYGISVTGYAGPDAGSDNPVGTAYIGISGQNDTQVFKVGFKGSRKETKTKFVYSALVNFWRLLKEEL